MRTILIDLILTIALVGFSYVTVHGQPGRREPSRPNVSTSGRNRPSAKPGRTPAPKPSQTASIVINANPSDAVLLLNGQQIAGPLLTGLKPGGFVLTARRVGYNEESRSITLVAGENAPINIKLEPLKGRLSVTPNVSDVEITVTKIGADQSQSPMRFGNAVVDLNLEPGDYEVSLSKEGYRGVKRTITLEAAGSIYLEPQLTRWPTETKPTQPLAINAQFEPATIKKKVLPTYPKAARAQHVLGTVVVLVEIDIKGKVISANATEGPAALRKAAESAAKQWEFNPAKKNGLAVSSSQRLVFNFVE